MLFNRTLINADFQNQIYAKRETRNAEPKTALRTLLFSLSFAIRPSGGHSLRVICTSLRSVRH